MIIFGSSGAVGTLVSIITIKYRKRKEIALTQQEVEKADEAGIRNAKELIELYKSSVKDLQELTKQKESILSSKLTEYEGRLAEYKRENEHLKSLVEQLKQNQIGIQAKLDMITIQSLQDCDKCSFKANCDKFIAKVYIKNSDSNGNDIDA